MERTMDRISVESISGESMSIFAKSMDAGMPRVRSSRRRANLMVLSPGIEQPAKPNIERRRQRRAIVERERACGEFELSRAASMAKELERQIEQANVKARSHRPALHGTRAADGGDQTLQSDALYAEAMQELDHVKREIRKLQRELLREGGHAQGRASADSRVQDSGVKPEAGEANEERVVAELAKAGGLGEGAQVQATWTRAEGIIDSDTSDATESFATASSSKVENEGSSLSLPIKEHHDVSLQAAAEAGLSSARTELASVKEEGIRFADSTELARRETARVEEGVGRIRDQEKKTGAQVRQLNDKVLRARARLEAVAADDARAEAALAELSSALRQLGEETEAAEKERALTELEAQCVRDGAEIAAAESRIRRPVRELEAARAAAARLKAAVDGATTMPWEDATSGDVTVARFEYEYLTGRAEAVRAAADKKVAAAEAWIEALRAGEKVMAMRAEVIEKEIEEAKAGVEARDDHSQSQQRAPRRRAAAPGSTTTPSFDIDRQRKARVRLSCLKVIAGKCSGHS